MVRVIGERSMATIIFTRFAQYESGSEWETF